MHQARKEETKLESDFDVLLAGCTTVYLEDFESDCPPALGNRKSPARNVEQAIERVLATLEADLRRAYLGAA